MRRDAAETGLVEAPGRATTAAAGAASIRLHATCIELGATGVLMLGASGSGKSDLALRLIDRGARLVGDDRLLVERRDGPAVRPAGRHAGRSARGARFRHREAPLVSGEPARARGRLAAGGAAERLPEPETYDLLGVPLPLLRLDPRAPSAGAKIRLALVAERLP